MTERTVGTSFGICTDPSGETFPPVRFTAQAKLGGGVIVDCRKKDTCGTCLWERPGTEQRGEILCITEPGLLVLDPDRREVVSSPLLPRGHDPVRFPQAEFKILTRLIAEDGGVVSPQALYLAYTDMGKNFTYNPTNTVKANVLRARRRLGVTPGQSGSRIIAAVRGGGYRINKPRGRGRE